MFYQVQPLHSPFSGSSPCSFSFEITTYSLLDISPQCRLSHDPSFISSSSPPCSLLMQPPWDFPCQWHVAQKPGDLLLTSALGRTSCNSHTVALGASTDLQRGTWRIHQYPPTTSPNRACSDCGWPLADGPGRKTLETNALWSGRGFH